MTRIALVAGGSRGLGLLIAGRLVRRGYIVAICARGEAGVEHAAERLRRASGRHAARSRGYVCDIADSDAVERLVADIQHDLGPIDVAITVAGIMEVGPAETMAVADFDAAIDVMLKGPIHVAWAVLPGMRQRRRGRIGTVTSIGGTVPVPHLLPYTTAKFGAVGFAEGLATELAGTGVTSTAAIPGLMRTGAHEVARFRGQTRLEQAWFSASASIPLLSTSAANAAERIVAGVLRGSPIVRVPWWTHLATRVHGVAPATTVRVASLVGRILPGPGRDPEPSTAGHDVAPLAITKALTVLGTRAARELGTRVAWRRDGR